MFGSDRIIALDIGASKLVIAEFLTPKTGVPQLLNYGIGELGVSPGSESHSAALIVSTLREQMRETGIKPGALLMTISGQAVFPRYVKLPPVARDKILQMVRYEAEQNVPFPIDEVVWDYQLLGTAEGEVNVMLVAVKVENVTGLTDCVQAAKLEPEVVDATPMALYNVVRHSYPDLDGCTMVLDIGARSSNLIFVEGVRIFSRSVPVAGNTVTQEIAKAFEVPFAEAEQIKKQYGLVGLGGVTAGQAEEDAERVAKISRGVVTRLHAEVNRSVNFYRSQQGGEAPSLVLLCGGSSVMPHTDTFFRDKLKVPVEYLNPFANIMVSPTIPDERINGDVQLLAPVVGLALRRATKCQIEINLMPPDLVATKRFRKRQPFFAAAAAGALLVMLCFWAGANRMRTIRELQLRTVTGRIAGLIRVEKLLQQAIGEKQTVQGKADSIVEVVMQRTQWIEVLQAIHDAMLEGMWLTRIDAAPEKDGQVPSLEIECKGFMDKLKDTPEATAIELFRNRLRSSPYFTDDTEITKIVPVGADDYAREFAIEIVLAKPLKVH